MDNDITTLTDLARRLSEIFPSVQFRLVVHLEATGEPKTVEAVEHALDLAGVKRHLEISSTSPAPVEQPVQQDATHDQKLCQRCGKPFTGRSNQVRCSNCQPPSQRKREVKTAAPEPDPVTSTYKIWSKIYTYKQFHHMLKNRDLIPGDQVVCTANNRRYIITRNYELVLS